MSGMHPRIVRLVRVAGTGTRKRTYKKRTGGAIGRPVIRIGVGIRRRRPTTTRRALTRRVHVIGTGWKLTGQGTHKRRVGRPRVRRARHIIMV